MFLFFFEARSSYVFLDVLTPYVDQAGLDLPLTPSGVLESKFCTLKVFFMSNVFQVNFEF